MSTYTAICPVCKREYVNTHEDSRQWCSVACQFAGDDEDDDAEEVES
jgi:hypothetical protein